jgi:excisionase family DNA binding protein
MSMLLPIPAYTVREAAKYLGVSRNHIYKMLRDGRLQGELDVCQQLRIPYDQLLYEVRKQEEETRR